MKLSRDQQNMLIGALVIAGMAGAWIYWNRREGYFVRRTRIQTPCEKECIAKCS